MVVAILFWLFLLSAVVMIFIVGRKIERQFTAMIVASVCATYLLNANLGWDDAEIYVATIDVVALVYALYLVSVTDRYWPMWFSAFQGVALATSIAQLVSPSNIPAVYTAMQSFWFFPAVGAMVVGVILDGRGRVQLGLP
jgi:hypothetical protein